MTDAYMGETQEPEQQRGPALYDGATALNRQTGQRIIYRVSPGGRGRWVALNYETADPQSRQRVETVQSMATIGQRTLPQAQEFIANNATIPTGGLQNALEGWPRALASVPAGRQIADADAMAALSNRMVGSNWQPGTTGMFNTAGEQELVRSRFPSPTRQGSANVRTYVTMAEEVAVQQAAVEAMQQWLTQHQNLQGFDSHFQRNLEPRVRREAREQAWAFFRSTRNQQAPQDNLRNANRSGPPAVRWTRDANGNPVRAE